MANEQIEEVGDPSVPSELLDLHVALEVEGVTAEEFKEAFDEDRNEG